MVPFWTTLLVLSPLTYHYVYNDTIHGTLIGDKGIPLRTSPLLSLRPSIPPQRGSIYGPSWGPQNLSPGYFYPYARARARGRSNRQKADSFPSSPFGARSKSRDLCIYGPFLDISGHLRALGILDMSTSDSS